METICETRRQTTNYKLIESLLFVFVPQIEELCQGKM